MITVRNLMILERFLLEIENRFKFELKFGEVVELYDNLKEIGRITNLFFMLQEQYHKKFNDEEKLKEYHNRIIDDNVNLNTIRIIAFVKGICNRFDDGEFKDIVTKNKFWEDN